LITVAVVWAILSVFFKNLPGAKAIIYPAVLLAFVAAVTIFRRTTCPRCSQSLSTITARTMNGRAAVATCCPHCGVSFDEPVEGSRLEPILDNVVTIRKSVERRAGRMTKFVFVGMGAGAIGFFAPNWSPTQITAFSLFGLFVVSFRLILNRTPCPKCNQPLKGVGGANSPESASCPHCGLGIDEPTSG
jgi:transcription elongation factor Elf1